MLYHHSPVLSDIEVNVFGHRFLIDLVAKHKSGELRCPATALIILNISIEREVNFLLVLRVAHLKKMYAL